MYIEITSKFLFLFFHFSYDHDTGHILCFFFSLVLRYAWRGANVVGERRMMCGR